MSEKLTTTPQGLKERLADIKETAEKEKVKLTPEVEKYIRDHLQVVHDKLAKNEEVFEEDLEFMEEVRMWVKMSEEWRERYPSVDDMKNAEEVQEVHKEAQKRHISIKQWLDLVQIFKHLMKKGSYTKYPKAEEFIDLAFNFPGKRKIKTSILDLANCTDLAELPEGLTVSNLILTGCTGLAELPEGLIVGEYLELRGCTDLTKLPEGLAVSMDLDLRSCTGLTKLPEGLMVGKDLKLTYCTGLNALSEGLTVGSDLYLSEDLNDQIKKDAKRLKKAGKIAGKIFFYDY